MGKKEQKDINYYINHNAKVEAVLALIRKQAPLTTKQEKFCNSACVERFLKAKGDNVKKAAKQLRACLSWRESIGTDNLIADEFSAEIAEGVAFVAGHDEESRPVVIFRIKQDYQKFQSQKMFTRLLVFTLEVAISTMSKNVEQFVLLFDACFFRSASTFMNLLLATLKIASEYYPRRLCNAFVIDPPSFFSYLWKGVRPFVELSQMTMVVSSLDFEESLDFSDYTTYPRSSSLRFNPSSIQSTAMVGSCASSRFSFTVSRHFDSLKPWYLSRADTSESKVGPTTNPSILGGSTLISTLNGRSLSFASPISRTPRGNISMRKSLFPSTPLPQRSTSMNPCNTPLQRTPRPSFHPSPATFFRRERHVNRAERSRESFMPFLKFYRRPFDEMIYRSRMKPPLGGLISIVSPQLRRRHVSVSQRF